MSTTRERSGIFAVLGAALCFGTTGTTQQLGAPDISPVAVASARLLRGSLFLFLLLTSNVRVVEILMPRP
jgi:DME family drug/metabolite transporter